MTGPTELERLQRQERWRIHRAEKLREQAALRREAEDTGAAMLDHRWALPDTAPTWWEPLTSEGVQDEDVATGEDAARLLTGGHERTEFGALLFPDTDPDAAYSDRIYGTPDVDALGR